VLQGSEVGERGVREWGTYCSHKRRLCHVAFPTVLINFNP